MKKWIVLIGLLAVTVSQVGAITVTDSIKYWLPSAADSVRWWLLNDSARITDSGTATLSQSNYLAKMNVSRNINRAARVEYWVYYTGASRPVSFADVFAPTVNPTDSVSVNNVSTAGATALQTVIWVSPGISTRSVRVQTAADTVYQRIAKEASDSLMSKNIGTYSDGSVAGSVYDSMKVWGTSGTATISDANMQTISNYVWDETENPTRRVSSALAIADGAITTTTIATGAIDADAIADNALDAGAIASNAITAAKIATDAITASQIATSAIGATEIGADAITSDKIAANAIGASEIADSALDFASTTSTLRDSIAALVWRDSVTAQVLRLVNATATVSDDNMGRIADSVWNKVLTGWTVDSTAQAGFYLRVSGDTSLWATPTDMWANVDTAASIDTSDLGAWMIANMASGLTLQAIGDSVWRRVVSATDTAVAGSYAKVIPRIDNSQSWRVKALTLGPNTDSTNAVGFTVNGRGTRAGILVEGGTAGVGVDISNGASATGAGLYVHSDAATYAGASFTGNTTGAGLLSTGGASAPGVRSVGGSTGGNGMEIDGGGTSGNGLWVTAGSGGGYGAYIAGTGSEDGLSVQGGTSGRGFSAIGGSAPGIYAAAGSGNTAGVRFLASGNALDLDADSTNIRSIPLTAQIWGADSATYQTVAATMASAASQTAATALTADAVAGAVVDTLKKAPASDSNATEGPWIYTLIARNLDAKVSGAATQTWNASQMDSVLNALETRNVGSKVWNYPFSLADDTAGTIGDSLGSSTYIQGLRYLYTYASTMTGEGAVQNLNEMLDGGTGGQLSLQTSGAAPGLKVTTSSATVPAVEVTSSAAAVAAKFENTSSGIAVGAYGSTGGAMVLSSAGESPLYISTSVDTPGITIYNLGTAATGRAKLIVDSVSGVGGGSGGGITPAQMDSVAAANPAHFYGPGLSGSGAYTVTFTCYDSSASPDSTVEGITVNAYNSSGTLVFQKATDGAGQTYGQFDAGTYTFKSYDVGYQFDSVVFVVTGNQSQTLYGADVTSAHQALVTISFIDNQGRPYEGLWVRAQLLSPIPNAKDSAGNYVQNPYQRQKTNANGQVTFTCTWSGYIVPAAKWLFYGESPAIGGFKKAVTIPSQSTYEL